MSLKDSPAQLFTDVSKPVPFCKGTRAVWLHPDTSDGMAFFIQFSSVQSLSRVQLCDPMNCSTPGLPVHHQLLRMDREAWRAAVHGVVKSRTRLSD